MRGCDVYGFLQAVESEQCPSFSAAMKAGKPVYTASHPSLADGLAVPKVRWSLHDVSRWAYFPYACNS